MGEVTATGGVLPFFRGPGGPRPAGFFSSPALDASSQLSGRSRRHLDPAVSIFRLPLSYSGLRGAFSSDSLSQLSPLSASERFSESVRSWRQEGAGWTLSGTGRAGPEGKRGPWRALLSRRLGDPGFRLHPRLLEMTAHARQASPLQLGQCSQASAKRAWVPNRPAPRTGHTLGVPSHQLEDSILCMWGPIPWIGTRTQCTRHPVCRAHTTPHTGAAGSARGWLREGGPTSAPAPTTIVEFLRDAVGVVGRELSEELALNSSELRLSEASLSPLLMELLSSQLWAGEKGEQSRQKPGRELKFPYAG